MSHPPDPLPPAPDYAHTTPADEEQLYFQGSPPLRAYSAKLALFLLIAAALIALGGGQIHENGKLGPWWVGGILIVVGLSMPFIPWLMTKRIRYRITNYRIDFERGLLSKNIDTLELWHVEDLRFHQSVLARIMDVGNIMVVAHDETMPQLMLFGIPNPRPIFEMLKQRVIAVKRQRGVIKMDNG